jgi:UDP-N-acetylmuramoyl-tripeptide--D-alanyl-D-alanine ligase
MKKIFKKFIVWCLTKEAKILLKRWQPKIIGVTGSVGKTSTKDAIYSAFKNIVPTRKNEKSFNSEIGVPLTILGLRNAWSNPINWFFNLFIGFFKALFQNPKEKWLVVEIGADRPGDIKNIVEWVKLDIAIINKIGKKPVHVEFFPSIESLIKEKASIISGLKTHGTLLLNGDEDILQKIGEESKGRKILYYGFNESNDIKASNYSIVYKEKDGRKVPAGCAFKINYQGKCLPLTIEGALGVQHAYPSLVAIGASIGAGLNIVEAIEGLRMHKTAPGRMRIIEGIKYTTIIDDTYNSSPIASSEALNTLKMIETKGRKIAMLGDMLELGKYSEESHLEIGSDASKICDILVCVGTKSRKIAEGALNNGLSEKNIFQFEKSDEAGKMIQNLIQKDDVILIKGSQGTRMEKITLEIIAEPDKAPELLVRQEKEWLGR